MRKKRLSLWILTLLLLIFSLSGCGYAGPEKAVRQEMDLIRKLDESTIKAFVSYEDIRLSHSAPLEIGAETTEAVKLFFKNFKYKIRSSSVNSDKTEATVELDITNLDAKQLAKDLCRAIILDSAAKEGSSQPQGLASSFALMKTCLEKNTYPLVTTPATVHLTNMDGTWIIQESTELEDALAGGLVSYLRDPYLLTPGEVLDCTLQPFASFTAKEWSTYLQLDDVFNAGSPLCDEMDNAIAEQIAAFFNYGIVSISENGNQAEAQLAVTSLDLESILNECRAPLLEYAQTSESIRATDEEISQKAAEYLCEALKANTQSSEHIITVQLVNNGYTWEVQLDEAFSDALLGGVGGALETLAPASADTSSEETEA